MKAECICERCGRDYPIWAAASEAWNLAVNRTQEHGDEWIFLCPTCFVRLHEMATGRVSVWELHASGTDATRSRSMTQERNPT